MTLRVGLLGAGFIGKTHAARLAEMESTELVAVCDRERGGIDDLNAKMDRPATAYTDFDAMLAGEELDALYVCLPPFAHDGEVQKAAGKGIHLFLEKPIAIDSAKARAMVDAIEAAGVKSQVGFHMRFMKSVRKLKAMIDEGAAGTATLFTGRYWTNMDGSAWWRDKKRSGGQIFEQVIHLYDVARYLFGDVAEANGIVSNLCHTGRDDYSIEDTSVGTMRFANGAAGVVTGSNCAVPMHFFGDFRAVYENVTLDVSCTGQTWVVPDRAVLYRGEEEHEEMVEDDDLYRLESEDFVDAILNDRPARTPARDGLEAIELIETIERNSQ